MKTVSDREASTEKLPKVSQKGKPFIPRKGRISLLLALVIFLSFEGWMLLPALLFAHSASLATVVITPASKDIKHNYTIWAVTGRPDASKHQVGARLLSFTTPAQSKTVKATGVVSVPDTYATGTLTISNYNLFPITVNAGNIIPKNAGGTIQMVLDATVTIPAGQKVGPAIVTIPAHVVQMGTLGNIPPYSFFYCNGTCPINGVTTGWTAQNDLSFIGGQHLQSYTTVQQSDINGAVNALIKSPASNPEQVLQGQIHANEQLISTLQCKPAVTSNHVVGDRAISVTVTATFTCTGKVYDRNGARALATKLLVDQSLNSRDAGYILENIATALSNATLTDAEQGTIRLTVNVEGLWIFQFGIAQKQQLARLLTGKTRQVATDLLRREAGVSQVNIQVVKGNGNSLPTYPDQINIIISAIPVPGASTPTGIVNLER